MTVPLTEDEASIGAANASIGTELVLEQDGMRIWHLRLKPGETIAAHRHDRPYFWTALNGGTGCSRFGDGSIVNVSYRAGETRLHHDLSAGSGFVHDLTNTGEADLLFVTVEFDHAAISRGMFEQSSVYLSLTDMERFGRALTADLLKGQPRRASRR